MDKEIYKKSIMEDIRNGNAVPRCKICMEDDPVVLEKHHFSGRANSEQTVLLCKNCHAIITNEQNKVSPKYRSKNAPYLGRLGYQIVTLGALLARVVKQLIKIGYELMKYDKDCDSGLYSKSRKA